MIDARHLQICAYTPTNMHTCPIFMSTLKTNLIKLEIDELTTHVSLSMGTDTTKKIAWSNLKINLEKYEYLHQVENSNAGGQLRPP